MTQLLVYPANLPGPISMSQQRAERRALTGLPGPRARRALWRDRLDPTVPVTFRFRTLDQAEQFHAWQRDEQIDAGAWFAAPWRVPQGGGGVFRFIQAPAFPQWLAPDVWECSGSVEIRGRSLPPATFSDYFLDIDSVINGGVSPIVGKTIEALNPAHTYRVSLAPGRLYTAWEQHIGANNWSTSHSIVTDGGETHHDPGVTYLTPEAAFAAFVEYDVTGTTSITLYIFDSPTDDNRGGLSFRIRG